MAIPLMHPARMLGLYGLAAAAGALFQWLNFPLPWLIGPMVLVGTIYATGTASATLPKSSRFVGQMIVGLQIGTYFTAQAVAMLSTQVPIVLSISALTILVAAGVALVTSRLTGRPAAPSFLSVLPFSPVEAAVLTERYGWSPGPIVLAQVLRIGIAVTTVPVALFLIDGWPTVSPSAGFPSSFDPIRLTVLLGLGLASAGVFKLLGLTNPFFMGPLLISALAAMLGLGSQGFPFEIVAAAQLILGVWLGSAFRRAVFLQARAQILSILLSTIGFLSLVVAGSLVLAYAFGQPWRALLLGAIPGGVTEMALTAKFLGVDVALVTSLQITRLLLVVLTIRWFLALFRRLDARR